MIRRSLGSTDMAISVIGIGAFGIGGWMWGGQDDADSRQAIHAALDGGVTWIDTAPIYGSGRADRVVASVLKERSGGQRPLVFTKFGHHLVDGQRVTCGSRAQVLQDCESSLSVLGVERIDLFQLHWPTADPLEETAAACAQLLAAGKIRAIGLCNADLAQLTRWQATGVPLHAVQNAYSIFKPDAEKEILPWCVQAGVGFLAYSPLMRGMLFGNWSPDKTFPPGDHRGERAEFQGDRLRRSLQAVGQIADLAQSDDMSCAELAIGCLMCHEGMTACIVGARTQSQGAFLATLGMPAKAALLQQVDAICAERIKDLESPTAR